MNGCEMSCMSMRIRAEQGSRTEDGGFRKGEETRARAPDGTGKEQKPARPRALASMASMEMRCRGARLGRDEDDAFQRCPGARNAAGIGHWQRCMGADAAP